MFLVAGTALFIPLLQWEIRAVTGYSSMLQINSTESRFVIQFRYEITERK